MKGPATAVRHCVGLDLGSACDFTALAVLERPAVGPADPRASWRPAYALRHLRRFPPGAGYPAVADAVRDLLRTPPLPGALLAVDQTGVGRATVDVLADALRDQVDCLFCPVTITAGHEVTAGELGGVYVPKKELVGTVQALLQTRRLQVARSLPDAPLLVKELESFKARVTAARGDTFASWREGQHDDLVLALALAAWLSEQALAAEAAPAAEGLGVTVLVAG